MRWHWCHADTDKYRHVQPYRAVGDIDTVAAECIQNCRLIQPRVASGSVDANAVNAFHQAVSIPQPRGAYGDAAVIEGGRMQPGCVIDDFGYCVVLADTVSVGHAVATVSLMMLKMPYRSCIPGPVDIARAAKAAGACA